VTVEFLIFLFFYPTSAEQNPSEAENQPVNIFSFHETKRLIIVFTITNHRTLCSPIHSTHLWPGKNNFNITLQCFLLCLGQTYLFGFELK
jgi:hypothetical protein